MAYSINKALVPAQAVSVISALEAVGYAAYITGPAVREMMLGMRPASVHIVTDAPLYTVKNIFTRCTQISEDTLKIALAQFGCELICAPAGDGGIDEALLRFAISADMLLYDTASGIIDRFGGAEDIEARIIRAVSVTGRRLAREPELMMSIAAAAAQLGFDIDGQTAKEIRKSSVAARCINRNMLRESFSRILMSGHPECIICLRELGILKYIMPELERCFGEKQRNKYHIYDVGTHIVKTVCASPADPVIRWAALMHDIGKPVCSSCDDEGIIHFYGHHRESVRIADSILHRLHMDAEEIGDILTLVEYHDVRIEASYPAVKRTLSRIGAELFEKLLLLQRADNSAKNTAFLEEKNRSAEEVYEVYKTVLREGQPYRTADLVINERDLIRLRYRAGREISDTLRALLDEVIADPGLNSRQYLLERAMQMKNKKDANGKRRKNVRL